ncbi:putative Na+/H+ antiporter [Pigmentiphaga sp.]|jgi:Predicted cation transporter|uniref:putative Na+/H+ antiporter n=1 Tax=Pigmentiphaga sp. TaxID=1977564 RepID=UPI0025D09D02|nr:putative Na+/H+ antiporter [Pigmentiphaga sp.]MBX6317815.1 putative Na+/H+ antiporter [Pigmentiphaga sp.]
MSLSFSAVELLATVLFAIAILHTFSVPVFANLAHKGGRHAGLWHMLSEVEAVFGFWASVLLLAMAALAGTHAAIEYMDTRNFTEPLFVFAIMVIAASRPILDLVTYLVAVLASAIPGNRSVAVFFVTLALVPLLGSFITEPAAMTLAAVMLRDTCFRQIESARFKYFTLGVLFVNVSIGGVLTSYAAPPVLMVASAFGWDTAYMLAHFGWRAACAVVLNALIVTLCFRRLLIRASAGAPQARARREVPLSVTAVHVAFLAGVVLFAHHPAVFMGLLMLFIGYTEAYKEHQRPLLIKEGLMVGFFLAGLVVLGGLQKWWLQELLADMPPLVLYWGAAALTAVTDNAALTYLGSLVEGTSEAWRYMLVAGAVTGGGLTVIANAPNPAGFAVLKSSFPGGTITPLALLLGAALPTAVAAFFFLLPA